MTQFIKQIDNDITLSLVELKDAQEIFSLVDSCRKHLRKWLPWVDGTITPDDTATFIEFASKQHAKNNGFHYSIRYEKQIAGIIGYHRIDKINRITELGYWLGEQFQGRGIMTRCCQALTDYAFEELELNRVEIRVAEENIKSCAIPQRLGFTREGILRDAERVNDRFVNQILFAVLRRDLSNTKKS